MAADAIASPNATADTNTLRAVGCGMEDSCILHRVEDSANQIKNTKDEECCENNSYVLETWLHII